MLSASCLDSPPTCVCEFYSSLSSSSALMSTVDATDYGAGPRPEQQLRNLFAMLRIYVPIRQRLAAAGILTMKLVAMTGSGPDEALAGLSEFIPSTDWPTGDLGKLEDSRSRPSGTRPRRKLRPWTCNRPSTPRTRRRSP